MPTITKQELKGEPARKAAAPASTVVTAPATPVLGTARLSSPHSISAQEAREQGENAVTRGALERAERHVSGFSPLPKAGDQPKRITVDREGKIIPEGSATEGGTVLVGAEAEAYEAAHGGAKESAKTANKERKAKSATKTRTAAKRTSAKRSRR